MFRLKQNPLFEKYLRLLLKWNRAYSLTSITDEKEIWIKHFEDSLAPLPFLPTPCRLLDIGTGAGFPGIPLKIAKPDVEVVLLDSQRKKCSFCEALIRELKLKNIQALQGRAEDKTLSQSFKSFDVIISRATFSLKDFLSLALSYAKRDGLAIAMKGRNWEENHAPFPLWDLKEVFDYDLSESLGKRTLLIFKRRAVERP